MPSIVGAGVARSVVDERDEELLYVAVRGVAKCTRWIGLIDAVDGATYCKSR